jgi:hypothetical protein
MLLWRYWEVNQNGYIVFLSKRLNMNVHTQPNNTWENYRSIFSIALFTYHCCWKWKEIPLLFHTRTTILALVNLHQKLFIRLCLTHITSMHMVVQFWIHPFMTFSPISFGKNMLCMLFSSDFTTHMSISPNILWCIVACYNDGITLASLLLMSISLLSPCVCLNVICYRLIFRF